MQTLNKITFEGADGYICTITRAQLETSADWNTRYCAKRNELGATALRAKLFDGNNHETITY